MVKVENKCTLAPRSPAHEVNSPRSGQRPYTHEPGDDLGGARSISDDRKEDSTAGLREKADDIYSHQDAPHTPLSDHKAEGEINYPPTLRPARL